MGIPILSKYLIYSGQTIADGLQQSDDDTLVARIAALAQLARFAPDAFEHKSDVIMAYLLKQILMIPSPPDPVCSNLYTF